MHRQRDSATTGARGLTASGAALRHGYALRRGGAAAAVATRASDARRGQSYASRAAPRVLNVQGVADRRAARGAARGWVAKVVSRH